MRAGSAILMSSLFLLFAFWLFNLEFTLEAGWELAPPKFVLKPASLFSARSCVFVFCFISTSLLSLERGARRRQLVRLKT